MSPHAQAEEFISSYTKLMQDDSDINNFQKVLEMKVKLISISLRVMGRTKFDYSVTVMVF